MIRRLFYESKLSSVIIENLTDSKLCRTKTSMRTTLLALYATASAAATIDMDYMSALQDAITKLKTGARSYRYKQREAIETTTFSAGEIERVHS